MVARLSTKAGCALLTLLLGAVGSSIAADGDSNDAVPVNPSAQVAISPSDAKASGSARAQREELRALVRGSAEIRGVPPDVADALVEVVSQYQPDAVGAWGEVGLMQVRHVTAKMLGFGGAPSELSQASTNIEFGVAHLARAWRIADKDLCRTLLKYTSHYAEEQATAASAALCRDVRERLAAWGSPLTEPPLTMASQGFSKSKPQPTPISIKAAVTPQIVAASLPGSVGLQTERETSNAQPSAEEREGQLTVAAAITPRPKRIPSARAKYLELITREATAQGLPPTIADAVVRVESGYDPAAVGGVGEIGLMQIRPSTAAMLGFQGNAADLFEPETNIRFGVAYLAKAWRLADGDLCRALMKYRAGHGEERMSPLSAEYCQRARKHLAALGVELDEGAPLPSARGWVSHDPRPTRSMQVASAVKPDGDAREGTTRLKRTETAPAEQPVVHASVTPVLRSARLQRSFWVANRARLEEARIRISVMNRPKESWAAHHIQVNATRSKKTFRVSALMP